MYTWSNQHLYWARKKRIPPTYAASEQHVKRAAFQGGHVWGQALVADLTLHSWGLDCIGQHSGGGGREAIGAPPLLISMYSPSPPSIMYTFSGSIGYLHLRLVRYYFFWSMSSFPSNMPLCHIIMYCTFSLLRLHQNWSHKKSWGGMPPDPPRGLVVKYTTRLPLYSIIMILWYYPLIRILDPPLGACTHVYRGGSSRWASGMGVGPALPPPLPPPPPGMQCTALCTWRTVIINTLPITNHHTSDINCLTHCLP